MQDCERASWKALRLAEIVARAAAILKDYDTAIISDVPGKGFPLAMHSVLCGLLLFPVSAIVAQEPRSRSRLQYGFEKPKLRVPLPKDAIAFK
jgi:hypothetical protein